MSERYGIYYTGKDDELAIYHMRSGKPMGLPIAFVRQGMRETADYLVGCANKFRPKSIYLRNRPGVDQS